MRHVYTILLLVLSIPAQALTIPQGTLYFDNNKTLYNAVCFVYGSDQRQETYVTPMTPDGNKWRVDIPQTVPDMYRFTFVSGDMREGLYTQDFNVFKDSISHQAGLMRTATSDVQMMPGDIYVPTSGNNWAQGTWMSVPAWESQSGEGQAQISGTLPVVYINTNGTAITDTETQVEMSAYIDPMQNGYDALGSVQAPVTGTIKGRGNWTWTGFDKKPYKLKFTEKTKVLGMPNNRHWCLQANADDYLGFLKMPAGFYISKAVGLRWTPRMRPVELVLNGNYMGLYFLTEHVRIAGHRVKIHEQADNETHPDSITGGWLVEIDNYPSANNIEFMEGNGQQVMISLREPSSLSIQQRSYLENQIFALNEALYASSAEQLKNLLDIDEAARYYLVQEIMEDCESYHGSCFLYKDRDSLGIADKWKFGPVWDFGNAYDRHLEQWIYDGPTWPQYWIGQLATWPDFQNAVKEQWWVYYHTQKDSVRAKIQSFAEQISIAAQNDAAVWSGTQNYSDNSNMSSKSGDFLWRYDWRIQWLYSQWGEGSKPATWDVSNTQQDDIQCTKVLLDGRIYIQRDGRIYTITGLQL